LNLLDEDNSKHMYLIREWMLDDLASDITYDEDISDAKWDPVEVDFGEGGIPE
jgi:hypothetical protein